MTSTRTGISLVTVMISLGIISIAAFIFIQMSGSLLFGSSRIDKSLKGQQVLVGVASDLQRQEYGVILDKICGGVPLNNPEKDLTGNCIAGNQLKPLSAQTQPPKGYPLINVLLSENGKASETGDTCVELVKCKLVADGDLLELHLRAHWKDPDPKKGLASRTTVLRRARW